MTMREGPHGPAVVAPTPAPKLDFSCLAPAYFALPYTYAYAVPAFDAAMAQDAYVPLASRIQAYVPLISRIQLGDTTPARRAGRPEGQRRGRAPISRAPLATSAGTRRQAASQPQQVTRRVCRSASPMRRTANGGPPEGPRGRGRDRAVISLLDRLSSRERPHARTPLEDRISAMTAPDPEGAGSPRCSLLDRLSSPSRGCLSLPAQSRSPSPSPPPLRYAAPSSRADSPAPAPLDRVPTATFHWDRPDRDVNALRTLPTGTRVVPDDRNNPCHTSVPIRIGMEVVCYLSTPFEDDPHIPALRLPGEHSRGPAPLLVPGRLRPVPPGDVLLHHHWGSFRTALWKRYGPTYISALMRRSPEELALESRTLAEWSDALRPGSYARRVLGSDPYEWTEDVLFDVGLLPASEQERKDMAWENDMFLFRRDVEQLAARLHSELRSTTARRYAVVWARVRDSIRRVWGPGLTYFPDAREAAYLDSRDDLVCLRHWRALARVLEQWELPEHLRERVHLATGGPVRELEGDLQAVLRELALEELGREIHTFPSRRIDAHSIM